MCNAVSYTHLDVYKRQMLHTTIAFTMAKGADGLNVLPQEAYVTGNLRFIPHQPTDESIELISEKAKQYDLETEVIYKDYPLSLIHISYDPDAQPVCGFL